MIDVVTRRSAGRNTTVGYMVLRRNSKRTIRERQEELRGHIHAAVGVEKQMDSSIGFVIRLIRHASERPVG